MLTLSKSDRLALYAARQYLTSKVEEKVGLRIPFDVYFQDPLVAKRKPNLAFDEASVEWEPGFGHGPTSARFAVVDYCHDTDSWVEAAQWDAKQEKFVDAQGQVLDRKSKDSLQFHQVNVWAILQRALQFFEGGYGLGRRVPWGFDGNRLIVVPHAGYDDNAYYDPNSKSLQFYYFDKKNENSGKLERIFTCLSTDVVHHEFGHAVLDGLRPYYGWSPLVETGALHEFVGDLTAILNAFRNNAFRDDLAEATGGDLNKAETLASLAEQFGESVSDYPYLRSALNTEKMSDVQDSEIVHNVSKVLTGAMFDIMIKLSEHYVSHRKRSVPQALWDTIQRMQRMAIQPLDLLPPADATLKDYALAVLRAEQLSNPTDPHGYRNMMIDVFRDREIFDGQDLDELGASQYLYQRFRHDVFHDIDALASSPAAAYRFLDDNRRALGIPAYQDVLVTDVCRNWKLGRAARRLPPQIILQYIWREDVKLEGSQFAHLDGKIWEMLCGGTLVFDHQGNLLSWMQKPGLDTEEGVIRRESLLRLIARGVQSGRIARAVQSEVGMLGRRVPPMTAHSANGIVRFERSSDLGLADDDRNSKVGGRRWEISS